MKIEEIEDLWSIDCKMDRTAIDNESLRIPELHNKYYKIFIREKITLSKKESDLGILLKEKWELYTGKLDQTTLQEKGWEQFDLKILRTDIDKYIDSDPEVINKRLDCGLQREKVKFLEEIIKVINNRSFQIKNFIDYLRWSQGSD